MSVAAHLTPVALGLLAFCVAAEGVQQICFKAGSNRSTPDSRPVMATLLQPLIWAGVGIWAVEVVVWIFVLQRAPLSLAYPVMTLTYVSIPLGGMLILRERPSRRQMAGAALIALGVTCVSLSGL
jgi:undecaprenyl phosphate-alpha-L-ara4N flippase subunit ArnE